MIDLGQSQGYSFKDTASKMQTVKKKGGQSTTHPDERTTMEADPSSTYLNNAA